MSRSLTSPVDPLNPTPPDFITVPHVQQLHSERGGEIQNSTQNPIEKNGNKNEGILKCVDENEINNDEYIEETIPEHEENSTHMIRTDQIPTVFRSPSHWETPESRTKSSSKSSPEIISVKNKETITWSDPHKPSRR